MKVNVTVSHYYREVIGKIGPERFPFDEYQAQQANATLLPTGLPEHVALTLVNIWNRQCDKYRYWI
jgi:hypothetical protein